MNFLQSIRRTTPVCLVGTRLSGFAAPPIATPDQAARELERRFKDQRFAGAVINGMRAAAISTTNFSGRSWRPPKHWGTDLSAPDQAG
jgi:hypothetical protein